MAIGALRALYEAGVHVPNDVAVVGFDGIGLGQFTTPALTTINLRREEMGRLAVEQLFAVLDGQQPVPREPVLLAELLVRKVVWRRDTQHWCSGRVGRTFGMAKARSGVGAKEQDGHTANSMGHHREPRVCPRNSQAASWRCPTRG